MSTLEYENAAASPAKRFTLDRDNGKIMGVCSGIADYLGVDVMPVRLAFVLGTVFGVSSLILVYLVIGLIAD